MLPVFRLSFAPWVIPNQLRTCLEVFARTARRATCGTNMVWKMITIAVGRRASCIAGHICRKAPLPRQRLPTFVLIAQIADYRVWPDRLGPDLRAMQTTLHFLAMRISKEMLSDFPRMWRPHFARGRVRCALSQDASHAPRRAATLGGCGIEPACECHAD